MSRLRNILLFFTVFIVVAGIFSIGVFNSDSFTASVDTVVADAGGEDVIAPQALFIAASAYPFINDVLARVVGHFVEVRQIQRHAAHEIDEVDAFFILDERADAWVRAGEEIKTFYLRGEHAVGDYYWLSPELMADVVRFIARSFSEVDPVHAVQYFDNAYAYAYELEELHQSYREVLGDIRKRTFSSVGEGFWILLEAYDLKKGVTVAFTLEDVRKRLSAKPDEYILAEVIFPATGIEDERISNRIILLDPFGYLFSGGTYVDFLDENMRQLLDVK